jgi:hypothetical protein
VSPRWAVAGLVEAPADQVFARVCAIGPAGGGQLAGPPGPATTTGTDGVVRYTAPIGQPPQTTVTVEVDPTRRTLAIQGHWWYRGVHTVTPHSRGSLVASATRSTTSRPGVAGWSRSCSGAYPRGCGATLTSCSGCSANSSGAPPTL